MPSGVCFRPQSHWVSSWRKKKIDGAEMQRKNSSLIHLLLWSVQDLASSKAWEVPAQAEPEAWVMFSLPSCVNISSSQTDLVMFPGTEHWKPAGGFCTSPTLELELLGGKAPGLPQKLMGHGEHSPAHPGIYLKTEQPHSSLCGCPGHCWFFCRSVCV